MLEASVQTIALLSVFCLHPGDGMGWSAWWRGFTWVLVGFPGDLKLLGTRVVTFDFGFETHTYPSL